MFNLSHKGMPREGLAVHGTRWAREKTLEAFIDHAIAQAPGGEVLSVVLLGMDDLLAGSLSTLLEALAGRPDLALPLATRLTGHPDVGVQ
jgi:hypothetical protein